MTKVIESFGPAACLRVDGVTPVLAQPPTPPFRPPKPPQSHPPAPGAESLPPKPSGLDLEPEAWPPL